LKLAEAKLTYDESADHPTWQTDEIKKQVEVVKVLVKELLE
jgi:hypothetical protein